MSENYGILIPISLKFVSKYRNNKTWALVGVMAWHQAGNKPLPEPMITQFTRTYMRHKASMLTTRQRDAAAGYPRCQKSRAARPLRLTMRIPVQKWHTGLCSRLCLSPVVSSWPPNSPALDTWTTEGDIENITCENNNKIQETTYRLRNFELNALVRRASGL